jgi:hypothetical protein
MLRFRTCPKICGRYCAKKKPEFGPQMSLADRIHYMEHADVYETLQKYFQSNIVVSKYEADGQSGQFCFQDVDASFGERRGLRGGGAFHRFWK